MFPNAHSIHPYLEDPHKGPTSRFCSDLALSLQCYVTAGYPERLSPDEVGIEDATRTPSAERDNGVDAELEIRKDTVMVGANSAVLYGPDGCWVGGYRKTNLFKTDLTWAKAGTATSKIPSMGNFSC
jgi:protein N-terminal amidase